MVKIELAEFPRDNSSLLSFSKKHPSIGQISLYQDRSPNYYDSLTPEGEIKQVVIGRDLESNEIIGVGHRTESNFLINGNKTRLGMLSGLKLDPKYKSTTALPRGYKYFRDLDSEGKSLGYFTTIQSENYHSIQVLESGKAGLPKYQFISNLITYTFSKNSFNKYANRNLTTKFKIFNSIDDPSIVPRILNFLTDQSKHTSVCPDYSRLFGLDFGEKIFYTMEDDKGIKFCLCLWNQGNGKNWIVKKYNLPLNFIRPFYNGFSNFNSYPKMPKENSSIPNMYISFLNSRQDAVEASSELLGLLDFAIRSYSNFSPPRIRDSIYTFTLDSSHNLNQILKKIPAWVIHSRAYFVYWEGKAKSQEIYNKIQAGNRIWEIGCL
ncbi:hypothetical protein [Leptospira sp. GIMC2001]|uniref:hypothetical protein n=1 Tax=Leptospira sp. GIMC2001 TaxID=1513297 RepID=UPI00234B122D|nr:hypothetical protein [Leptospira sp. GIMC2001]WCL49178.1 hypothetical protein O4O04_18080 [Leptospira sp. GIMC2001]